MARNRLEKTGWFLGLIFLLLAAAQAADPETLILRAYRDGKSLAGLKKEDLKLTVNGAGREIVGLEEVRRSLSAADPGRPRLVTLIFNISDFKMDLAPAVEFIFAKALRPGDRLLLYTNNFFLGDHVVTAPGEEKKRVLQIIDFEKRRFKVLYQGTRVQLTDLLNSTAGMIAGQSPEEVGNDYDAEEQEQRRRSGQGMQGVYPEAIRRNFIHMIVQTAQAYKKFFLNLNDTQLRSIADYLGAQGGDKWGFVFYERPNFFIPEPQSFLAEYLSPSELYKKMHQELYSANTLNEIDIGKAFVRSGATWSTLAMTPTDRIPLAVSSLKGTLRLDRRKIASEGERVFPQVSRAAGGVFVDGNKIEDFLAKAEAHEDLFYRLTFAGEPAAVSREVRIETASPCDLVYDDQKRRPQPLAATAATPVPVRVAGMQIAEGALRINLEAPPEAKLRVSVQVSDEKMNMLLNKVVEPGISTGAFEVALPSLAKGKYDLVIEATETASRRNDLALFTLEVSKQGIRY